MEVEDSMIKPINTSQPYYYISKAKFANNTDNTHYRPSQSDIGKPENNGIGLHNHKAYSQPLISFGAYDFSLKSEKGLTCPCCGVTMSTNEEINSFVNKMTGATGNKIITEIEKYEDRLPEVELSVTNRLKIEAEKYDRLDLNGLLRKIQNEPKKELEKKQKVILNEIKELAENLSDDTYKVIKKDIDAIDKIITEGKNGQPFKRKILIKGMEKVRDRETSPKNIYILEKIVEKTMDMPTSSTDANAFIVKYCRRTTPEIARRLIEPSQATAEHIKPHSKKGHDGAENYLSECKKCNNDRGNISYTEWLKIHPEMIKNTQIYMDEVIEKITNGSLKNFDFYPAAVKKALFEESGGKINLDISKHIEFRKQLKRLRQTDSNNNNQPALT